MFTKRGGLGVIFFFVLSGFLITYILLHEKQEKKYIDLKKFYARRILRIWPLYYAMLLFAFATPYILNFLNLSSSSQGYEPNWLVSICFLENYKMMFSHSFPNVSPLGVMWSLCVEEHFYIIWGILFYFLPINKTPIAIGIAIVVANISRAVYGHFGVDPSDILSNIDFFAFGAIPAYILIARKEWVQRTDSFPLTARYLFLILTVMAVMILPETGGEVLKQLHPIILGASMSVIIFFTLSKQVPVYISDNSITSRIGKYTYGLYLYHVIIINLLLQLAAKLPFVQNWPLFVVIAFISTLAISVLSYYAFEQPFLRLKRYFY
jgi:peptidoglycan/LPS O-acetylase OafA/YrhL